MENMHFIGIGGIGMSALARIYLDKGYRISGSDVGHNDLISELIREGAVISRGHVPENVPLDCDLVIKSTCIKDNNPEIVSARNKGVPVILRGELLKRTIEMYANSFAVTGTHGKTTTTALVAHIMQQTGIDPTVIVGGEVETFAGNAKTGGSAILIAEVDESDGYFRNLSPRYAAITNIEREHMEHYGSMGEVKNAFRQFAGNITAGGGLVVNGHDLTIREVVKEKYTDTVKYGMDPGFDISCLNYQSNKHIEFDLLISGDRAGTVKSSLIGDYNIMNILAAVGLFHISGLYKEEILEAIRTFPGVKRRFDKVGTVNGINVVEDYAHHPTEIRSVIKAARNYSSGRILTVFQPHRYSRTLDLKDGFKTCFQGSDMLVLTDIYSAHEEVREKISLEELFDVSRAEDNPRINFLKKTDIPSYVAEHAREDDLVLVLGAGDIREISSDILREIGTKGLIYEGR